MYTRKTEHGDRQFVTTIHQGTKRVGVLMGGTAAESEALADAVIKGGDVVRELASANASIKELQAQNEKLKLDPAESKELVAANELNGQLQKQIEKLTSENKKLKDAASKAK